MMGKRRRWAGDGVTVLVCGDRHRHDDGAALAAADRVSWALPHSVEVRRVGQLEPGDLVDATRAGRCLVVDAVRGAPAGTIVAMPLTAIVAEGPAPASSHALPLTTVIGLAEALGADMERARFLGIAGEEFDLGEGLSPRVEEELDSFVATIADAVLAKGTARYH